MATFKIIDVQEVVRISSYGSLVKRKELADVFNSELKVRVGPKPFISISNSSKKRFNIIRPYRIVVSDSAGAQIASELVLPPPAQCLVSEK